METAIQEFSSQQSGRRKRTTLTLKSGLTRLQDNLLQLMCMSRVFACSNDVCVSDDWIKQQLESNTEELGLHQIEFDMTNRYHFEVQSSLVLHCFKDTFLLTVQQTFENTVVRYFL